MKLSYKLWLSNEEDEKIFGDGPCELLKKVETLGSLNKAAHAMNMAYSKAFRVIKKAEEGLGYKLLTTEIGGAGGGGSRLTEEAKLLVEKYENFEKQASKAIEKYYEKTMK